MVSLLTAVTGLTEVRFGCGMREPVTISSPTSVLSASWAMAGSRQSSAAAPQIIDDANRRRRLDWVFNSTS